MDWQQELTEATAPALISLAEARERGLARYFTGKPCKHGHVAERRTNDTHCVLCKVRRSSKYYEENKGQRQAAQRDYYSRHKSEKKATATRYRKSHPEVAAAAMRKYREKNPVFSPYVRDKRRAKRLNAVPKWFGELDEFVIKEAISLRLLRTKVTGIKWEVDHIVPLKSRFVCGFHAWNNVRVIPRAINKYKFNRLDLLGHLDWIPLLSK